MTNKGQYSKIIKDKARDLGFMYCGIARSGRLDQDADRLESWLNKGYHGDMKYMEKHFEQRLDPGRLLPGARSVITLLLNYFPARQQGPGTPRISKYAFGQDYHEVIRGKLQSLLEYIRQQIGPVEGRGFVDSAPVLERSWALRSGLGWIGRNGNLITQKTGSFFFIATLITDLELQYDDPFGRDYCGTCTRCVEACPTQAILPDKTIDGSRCISYFTIELKDLLIPDSFKDQFQDWIFGCDTCQDVCPWNRFSQASTEPAFEPLMEILHFSRQDWAELTEESFKKIFRHSPLKRAKWAGIQRNLSFTQSDQNGKAPGQ